MVRLISILLLIFISGCSTAPTSREELTRNPQGDISAESRKRIRAVVLSNMNQIKDCYEQVRKDNDALEGRFTLSWTISDEGTIREQKVLKNTFADEAISNCALEKLATWSFPKAPKGQSVGATYPFEFKAKK
jgi:TonB family protein